MAITLAQRGAVATFRPTRVWPAMIDPALLAYPAAVAQQAPSPDVPNPRGDRPDELGKLVPFLKWPGGKRWFVDLHQNLFRHPYDRYIEPFLGAGSVYFHVEPARAILGDLNGDLITTYRGIQQDPSTVQVLLEQHHLSHSTDYYYEIRGQVPSSLVACAARMIYLNRTCFNGIYRVNRRGEFNVPIGTRDRVVRATDNFAAIAQLLSGADLRHSDFEPLVDEAQADDLVFLDPPYTVRHNSNGFILYNEQLFSWDDQERLAKAAARAVERGARVIVTNASHSSIRRLYPKTDFRFLPVSRYSAISAKLDSRKRFEELVIISKQRRRASRAAE